jgi:hypothetical protein
MFPQPPINDSLTNFDITRATVPTGDFSDMAFTAKVSQSGR